MGDYTLGKSFPKSEGCVRGRPSNFDDSLLLATKHKATHNFCIHFPIFTKLHRLARDSALTAYICAYWQSPIAPPTGGWKHHFVYTLAYNRTPPTELMLTTSILVRLLFCHGGLKVRRIFSKVWRLWPWQTLKLWGLATARHKTQSHLTFAYIVWSSPNFIGCTWAPPRTHTCARNYTCL